METVIQDMAQINSGSQPRWDRFERADLLEQYQALRTQGLSVRQAAQELKVPRTTLQAWRVWHDTLDICPHVAESSAFPAARFIAVLAAAGSVRPLTSPSTPCQPKMTPPEMTPNTLKWCCLAPCYRIVAAGSACLSPASPRRRLPEGATRGEAQNRV